MASKPKKAATTKAESFSKEQSQETVKKVGQLTIDSASKKVTEASLAIGKTLADATAQLQAQLQEFTQVSLAVDLKKKELEGIYGAEQILKEIGELEAEFENKKITLEQDYALFQGEQSAERQKEVLERQKEAEDFDFELNKTRREEQLKYEEETRLSKAALRDQEELQKKGWTAREEILQKAEAELTELRAKVSAFPAELDGAVKKAEAIVGNSMKRDSAHQIALLQKDFDTAKMVADNTIKSLNDRLISQDNVIGQLQTRLNAADERVTTIATKALEAAASTKSLADVQNLIQTQNNGQPARKA